VLMMHGRAGAVRNTIPTQSHTRFAQPVGTNEIVLAHTDRTLSIWDLNLGQRLHHFPQRHTIDPVTCMATVSLLPASQHSRFMDRGAYIDTFHSNYEKSCTGWGEHYFGQWPATLRV